MTPTIAVRDDLDTTAYQGRICAVAMECLRDLEAMRSEHPRLLPARPFGPTIFSGIALAHAFACPRPTAERIRVAARVTIWAFAADWLLDTVTTSRAEVSALVDGCRAVADGAAPDPSVPLHVLLASLRDELAAVPDWSALAPVWRAELGRYLAANLREWDWKAARSAGGEAASPTFEEYLANADNLGATFVNVSHWAHVGAARTSEELARLASAGADVQRALRLLNDLATYDRDRAWGDLNALMLGPDEIAVRERLDELVAGCAETIGALAAEFPEPAAYLRRQLAHSTGFYGTTDYWDAR
jgi:terpene synthase-like protein